MKLQHTAAFVVVVVVVVVRASSLSSSARYKRSAVDTDLDKVGSRANGSGLEMTSLTPLQCARWCSTWNCTAYSFRPTPTPNAATATDGGRRRRRGTCRLCTATTKFPVFSVGANLYSRVMPRGNVVSVGNLLVNKTTPNSFFITKTTCLLQKGNLPNIYPDISSYQKMNATVSALGGKYYVDLRRFGDYQDRKFLTGFGDVMDANAKASDPAQFWAPGQPNATSNDDGGYVVMTPAGLDDVGDTVEPGNLSRTVLCQNDSRTYRTIPGTAARFYKPVPTGATSMAGAASICEMDGARLTDVYWTANGSSPVFDDFRGIFGLTYSCLHLGGRMNVVPGQILQFQDGTRVNYSSPAAIAADRRQVWSNATNIKYPQRLTGIDCLVLVINGWQDENCIGRYCSGVLCERDWPF